MGVCKFCGKPAGLFRSAHKECRLKYETGKSEIIFRIAEFLDGGDVNVLDSNLRDIASSSYIQEGELHGLVVAGWEQAVERAFEDGILSEEEEDRLIELSNHFALSKEELDQNSAFTKLVKGAVLRDIMNGKIPQRQHISGRLPFNLLKSETMVWVFFNVDYYEQRTRTKYVGGSQGVSIRIAKGIYYRTGAFKGERIQTTETVHADRGLMGITTKHIYFAGNSKRFRIPYRKIVTFDPYSDGIGVQRDAQTAKPQLFITGDGWFTYNLVVNLAQM